MRGLPNGEVILAGLAKPDSPWAWQELEKRAKAGQLESRQAMALLDDLTGWMRQTYPDGYDQPLHWLRRLLDELGKRQLVTDEKILAFLEAFYGKPTCEPLLRVRENEPQSGMSLTCRWRNPWQEELFGLKLLNEMRSITIDGKEAVWRNVHPNCEQYEFYGNLELPALVPGKYSVRFEIESALILKADLVGLAPDTLSEDWPPAKRRWTRVCESELVVYPEKTEIVRPTEDPALDPVASGAISVKQVIIRSDGIRAKAAVAVVVLEKDNTGQKLLVPISFDVSLRVSGETHPCGHFWSAAKGTRGGYTPNSGSHAELSADIKPLNPEVREAEVILTPNPKSVEKEGSIDRIWGREIVFPHVRLVRQDLREGDKPYFGPVIERVVNDDGAKRDLFIDLDTGKLFSPLPGLNPSDTNAFAVWLRDNGVDAMGETSVTIHGLVGMEMIARPLAEPLWESLKPQDALADEVLRLGTPGSPVFLSAKGELPETFLFRTRKGGVGILQITGFSDNPRGVRIRYKLVQKLTRE